MSSFGSPMSIVFLVFVFMALVGRVHGQNKTSLPSAWYRGVSSDSSGTYLTAVVDYGPIFYSNDSGVSWQVSDAPNPGRNFYNAVAASSTGQYVIVSSYRSKSIDFGTLVSSDYGQHFTSAFTYGESAVAVSATGQYMVSMGAPPSSPNYCVSYSDNYGVSFTTSLGPNTASNYCNGIAIDSSGTYVVLSVYSKGLWVSNNVLNVSSWQLTYKTDIPIEAIAFGGTSFYAGYANLPGYVIQSTDYGYNWTIKGSIPTMVYSIAVDSTGVNLLVSSYTGLYLSNDSGISYEWIYSGSVSRCAMNGNTNLTIFLAESEDSDASDVYVGNPQSFMVIVPTPAPTSSPDDTISPGIIAAIAVGSFALCCVIACIFIRFCFGRLLICWPANEPEDEMMKNDPLKEVFLCNV